MPEITRGERTVQLFAHLISNPDKSYSISDLMEVLQIPEGERRNVQRDMSFLVSMNNGAYIQTHGKGRSFAYQSAIKTADRLLFPNFENTMLHFVFLQRIANIYPATSELISTLLEKINDTLPDSERKALEQVSKDLNTKILFMGTPPNFEEDANDKLKTILRAIHDHRKILVEYAFPEKTEKKVRIPLMVIIYQNEIYIGCESQSNLGKTYVLKFRRIKSVELTQETFQENPKAIEMFRKRVTLGSAILGTQDPKAEDVEIIFAPSARFYLDEKPFHRSMKVEELKNGQLRVTMKVEANELLYRWVLSYADSAEVLKPYSLRKRLRDFSNFLYSTYYQR